ncbi:MAG: WG repeat-containing protein [Gemmatales bacterium]
MPPPATPHPRRPYKLLTLGCLLLALAAAHAYWPRSTDILIPVFNGSGKYGFINDKGQLVHSFQWEHVNRFSKSGLAGVTLETPEGKRWGAIDRQGKVVIPYVWEKGGGFLDSGYAMTVKNQKWGLINQQGTVVVPHEWDFIEPIRTKSGIDHLDSHGWAKVSRGRGTKDDPQIMGWVDHNGKIVIPIEYREAESFDEQGWAKVKRGTESGWINRQGKWVMPPEWEACSSFDEYGWAAVFRNGKSGYIDRQGKIVLPLEWDYCWEFHPRGYAQVMKGKMRGLIDRTGKLIIGII